MTTKWTVEHLTPEAIDWLANGERGLSSETMFESILGFPVRCNRSREWGPYTPSDTHDFRRCYELYKNVPGIKEGFAKMRDVSRQWANLVEHWDTLCHLYETVDVSEFTHHLWKILDGED